MNTNATAQMVTTTQGGRLPSRQARLNEATWVARELIDAHYGTAFHHIGDGDGIPKKTADRIRKWIEVNK